MRSISSILACAALVITSSCSGFLDAEKATADPNNPTAGTINLFFLGTQANIFAQQEGAVAMTSCIWMQQCAGVNGRFVETYGLYGVNPQSHDLEFQSAYTAGGLIGLRKVQDLATTAGDVKYRGVAKVMEAMNMMFIADVWGAAPYTEAVGVVAQPAFDSQASIYAALLTLLDGAITDMGGAGVGPSADDLIYGGDMTKWIRAAHMLKARIYLHTAEQAGNTFSTAAYTSARAEALLGFASDDDDFLAFHTPATSERNMWAQFQSTSFGPDLVAGSTLVNIMNAQNDPRLPEYFGLNNNGGYGGYNVTTQATPVNDISPIAGSARTNDDTFAQPIMTFEERELIIAEADFRLAATPALGGIAAAPRLNAVRALHGKGPIAAAAVDLNAIMTEKYILLFGNIEAWNDYKRTCLPVRQAAAGSTVIPGRLFYGDTEEQTNSTNTPPSTAQNLATVRNANDPNACP